MKLIIRRITELEVSGVSGAGPFVPEFRESGSIDLNLLSIESIREVQKNVFQVRTMSGDIVLTSEDLGKRL